MEIDCEKEKEIKRDIKYNPEIIFFRDMTAFIGLVLSTSVGEFYP